MLQGETSRVNFLVNRWEIFIWFVNLYSRQCRLPWLQDTASNSRKKKSFINELVKTNNLINCSLKKFYNRFNEFLLGLMSCFTITKLTSLMQQSWRQKFIYYILSHRNRHFLQQKYYLYCSTHRLFFIFILNYFTLMLKSPDVFSSILTYIQKRKKKDTTQGTARYLLKNEKKKSIECWFWFVILKWVLMF